MRILSIFIFSKTSITLEHFKVILRHSPVLINENINHCTFCGEKPAIYYCENCNLSFCEDCGYSDKRLVHECGQCRSSNIEVRHRNSVNGEIYICRECGSLDVEVKLIIHRTCPGCRSSRVIPIAKKRLTLINQMRDVISGFKFGYQELKVFLRDYRAVRQKTLALRAVGYLHDPVIEQTLLSTYEAIKSVFEEILERATQEIDLLRLQIGKYYDFSKWKCTDFPQIELLIRQIYENVIKYQTYVRKILAQPKKEQGLVQSKLNVIRYYKSIYDEFTEHLNLFPGELPVCAFKDIKFSKSTIQGLKKGKGILFLTDQRLIFIRKRGIIRKKIQRIFNFSFNHILNVTIIGRFFKKLVFILDQGNLRFSASKRMMEAILDYLNISVNFGKYRINDGKVLNTLDQIQLSTKHLEKQIDRKIVQLMAGTPFEVETESPLQQSTDIRMNPSLNSNNPLMNTNRMLFKLQTEKFSIEQTIQNLERKFRTGGINATSYIQQFRNLQSELFIIEKKLDTLKSELNYDL